jgi:putative transposase
MSTEAQKYKNQYRIKSARLQGHDYSLDGLYFITICTKDKEHFFGEIENGKMILNDIGKIIQEEWLQTPIMRPNVFLDEWVIMPNHLHGILEILYQIETPRTPVETPRRGVSTLRRTMIKIITVDIIQIGNQIPWVL